MACRLLSTLLWVTSVYSYHLQFPQLPLADSSTKHIYSDHESNNVSPNAALPTVDLGYTKHKAVDNPNPKLYKFQSIRYAAPPVGSLRFKAPQPPLDAPKDTVEDGSGRKECLQANVNWAVPVDDDDCTNCECCEQEKEDGSCETALVPCPDSKSSSDSSKQLFGGFLPKWDLTNPDYYSEDCLFLDVWTPKEAFDQKDDKKPVIVWFHGGAYVFGGKSLYFPGGILKRSLLEDLGGVIFVSLNYRMGALGFAAGNEIMNEDVNAGLLDQRRALDWVKEHIGKFGGDPDQVTIVGLSAGGGSILHHLTAYGGEDQRAPFRRAVSLSGGWQPIKNRSTAEKTFQKFKELNKVKTLEELRGVSEEQIRKTNLEQINNAPPGSFLYNPTAWGTYSPDSPAKLLEEGRFDTNVDVLLSHAFDEGGPFTKAFEERKTTLSEFVDLIFPDIDADEREFILEQYNKTGQTETEKIGNVIGDATFRCHVTYVSDAKRAYVYRQRWNIINSNTHGGDLRYLFYQSFVPVNSIRSALILQDYVVTFALLGIPLTFVTNPEGVANPAFYQQTSRDRRAQFLDSGDHNLPAVSRGELDSEQESLCRIWQQLSPT